MANELINKSFEYMSKEEKVIFYTNDKEKDVICRIDDDKIIIYEKDFVINKGDRFKRNIGNNVYRTYIITKTNYINEGYNNFNLVCNYDEV